MASDEIATINMCVITAPELAPLSGRIIVGVAVPWVENPGLSHIAPSSGR